MNGDSPRATFPALALFASFYLALLLSGVFLRFPWPQWVAVLSASAATALTIALWDRGNWRVGFVVEPRRGIREFVLGAASAVILIGAADLVIAATTPLSHGRGEGFPWFEFATVFLPAAVHEELMFRGYPFQRLLRWNRPAAIFGVSALFAGFHLWNDGVTPLAIANVFLGGVLLSLAYERYQRLWFPIGIHLMWNLMSGPILGHSVSGYSPDRTVFTTIGAGSAILTGGAFGIEGSIVMTVVEGVAVVLLWRGNSAFNIQHSTLRIPVSGEGDIQ